MKILIVDDNVDARMILRKNLESDGHAVEEAADGAAALERAKAAPPDMIISDIPMPRLDGFQLCRAVEADNALKGIPFVFYTATYTTEKDRNFALSLGASRFIVKPTEPEEFIGIIKDVLANGEKGLVASGAPAIEKDTEYLKEHQARLIQKLEVKLDRLQEANLALAREIEERKKAYELLNKSEAMLAKAQQIAHIGNWEWDPQTEDLYWSDENYRIFGLAKEVKPSVKMFLDTVHPDDLDHVNKSIAAALRGKPYDIDIRIIRPDGEERWINARATVDFDEAVKPVRMFGVVLDINERKMAEQEIRRSEEQIRQLVEHAPIAMTVDDGVDAEGPGIMMNRKFTDLFGYTAEDVPDIRHWWPLAYPDEQYRKEVRQEWIRRAEKAVATSGGIEPMETRVACKDGSTRHIKIYMSSIGGRNIATFEDLTEQKLLEGALREAAFKYRIVANNTSDWEFWMDPEGKFIYTSPSCNVITGYTIEEFMADQFLFGAIIHPDDRPAFDKHFHAASKQKMPGSLQFRVVRPDGGLRWIDHVCQPVFDREREYLGTRGSNRDITEHKQAEEAVKSALAEKEVLLKEVHHRVKNNMQIISSLLNLQAQKIQSPDLKMVFDQACSRIKSMSFIHEMLYNNKDYSKIDCGEYLNKLIKDLVSAAKDEVGGIKTTIDVDEIVLGVDTAIPLGLITNELVTNALKYAFPQGGGELTVSLTTAGDKFRLAVKDNGVGLPAGFDIKNVDTLGLRLVSVMVKQIRGAFRISSKRGTEAVITFKQ